MACLTLAGLVSTLSAQQTAPPANTDSGGQTQSQASDQSQSQPASNPQNAPAQNPNPGQPSQDQNTQQTNDQNKNQADTQKTTGKVAGTSDDRLFYTLPNFLSVQDQKLPPLSVKDKFKVVALGNFDYIQYPWWGILAAISQANNSEPQFRQGWLAYAKRYGTTAGDSSVENFMTGALFPSILRQDPRFYYSEKGGTWRRTGYAIGRIFVTRSDSGHNQFNFSEIFGAATAAAISDYSYHPKSTHVNGKFVASDRTLSNTADVFATQIGLDTVTFIVKEFWPDIHRKMGHKHAIQQSGGSDSNSKANP